MDEISYKGEITRLQKKIVSRNKKISTLETALQKQSGIYAIWKEAMIFVESLIFKFK